MAENTFQGGIPTAQFVDHAGYTVPNLEQAIAFFVDVLGSELLYRAGPYLDEQPGWMQTHLNVASGSEVRLAVLRCGPTNNIELVEFKAPDQDETAPKVSDVGGRHMAFAVGDMEGAVAYLRQQPGVTVFESFQNPSGMEANVACTYFTTPWGMYTELIKRPPHMPYEQDTSARLFQSNSHESEKA